MGTRAFAFCRSLRGCLANHRRNDEDGGLDVQVPQNWKGVRIVIFPTVIKRYGDSVVRKDTVLLVVLDQFLSPVENKPLPLQVGHLPRESLWRSEAAAHQRVRRRLVDLRLENNRNDHSACTSNVSSSSTALRSGLPPAW